MDGAGAVKSPQEAPPSDPEEGVDSDAGESRAPTPCLEGAGPATRGAPLPSALPTAAQLAPLIPTTLPGTA